jgi:hypothetical protein
MTGSSPARKAIASFGRSSEVQTILVACGDMAAVLDHRGAISIKVGRQIGLSIGH